MRVPLLLLVLRESMVLALKASLFSVLVLVIGCSNSTSGLLQGDSTSTSDPSSSPRLLSITPLTKTVALGGSLSLEASGGNEPYSFEVYYGNGSINSVGTTGTYTAPLAEGVAVVRVQDTVGDSGYATIEITDIPVIQPSLKTLAVGNRFPFAVLSGKSPYRFSVVSGEGSIDLVTGEFVAGANPGSVTVRVTDSDGRVADAAVTVNPALSFASNTLYVQAETTHTLVATGGVPPYVYRMASGAGTIDKTTGVYTAPKALGVATISVIDSVGNFDLAVLNVTSSLQINPASALVAKNSTLAFSALGGVPPYSYAIQAGGIGGLLIPGLNTADYAAPAGTGSATIRVTDSLGHTSDAVVTITDSLSFTSANLILAINNSFDVSTIVTGGTLPLTYTVPVAEGSFSGSTYTAPNTPGVYMLTVYDSNAPTPNSVTMKVVVNSALSLLPATATMTGGSQKSFSASGGVPPFTYSIQGAGGGSISATTGLFTAPASSASPLVLVVTDARGNTATSTVTVQEVLAIVPTSKTLNASDSFTFTATGGIPPYLFTLLSGSGTLHSTSGLYTAPGSSGLATVRVEDATGNHKEALITILNPLSIAPPTIALIRNGAITFTASGGAGPYTFSVSSGGGSVHSTTGVYSAPSTVGTSTVRVTDSLGSIKDAIVTIYDGLTITPFTKNLPVNQTFTFTATGGQPPYTYGLVSGVGAISTAGAYSSPTAGAALVRVTDTAGNTSDATVSVNSALTINPTSKTLGVNNQFTLSALGGVPPYAFSVLSGSGTVTTAGDYKAPATSTNAVVRVTDAAGSTADAMITVNDALTISPPSTTLAAGSTQSYITAGGVGPYTYAVVSGGGSFAGATYTAPSIASGSSVSIVVTDTLGNTASATVTIQSIFVTISNPNSSTVITASNKASFPVSGTCSESGRTVSVSATGGITATPTCSSGTWSTTLNLTSVADGSVTITATHMNINNVAATPASVTLSKDGSNPTITITSPTTGSYVTNSVTVSGACTKTGPVTVAVTGGVTGITTCDGSGYSITLNLTSLADGALTITADHTDSAGNTATQASVTVTKDSVAPVVSAFSVSNSSPTASTTYNLTFTATGSPSHYCILENSTTVGSCSWQTLALPTTFVVNSTNNAKVLSAWVKDLAGNISARVDASSVTLNTVIPSAPTGLALSDPATSPGSDTTPTLLVSGVVVGDTITIYTDSSCTGGNLKGSATVTTGTTVLVTSSALTDNTYTFYAKATNAASTSSTCSTANVSYVLDSAAPTSASISINGAAAYTTSTTVPLTLAATGATQMYITNTAGCGSGGTYEAYATSKSGWVLTTANTTNTVYAKFKDAAGNETACIDDTIMHDNIAPTAPTGLSLGSVPTSDTTTPTITWTAATDTGGSGVASYQVQVYSVSTGSVNTWTSLESGNAIIGSSGLLVHNSAYYMKVRAIDYAGNIGAEVQSTNWIANVNSFIKVRIFSSICAIKNSGALYCWGDNFYGQVGNNSTSDQLTPVQIIASGVTSIDGSNYFSNCAATSSGALYCWGNNDYGQIGNGTSGTNRLTPYQIFASGVSKVSMGSRHLCAIVNGGVYCWGHNGYGQIGNGVIGGVVASPVQVITSGATDLKCGQYHSCAVVAGALKCWGANDSGQVGNNSITDVSTPIQIIASGVTAISSMSGQTCAIVDGSLNCWGNNAAGTVGDNSTTNRLTPYQVFASGITSVVSGNSNTCSLINAGELWCWGNNGGGQIGNNSIINRLTPYQVFASGASFVDTVSHSCAIVSGALKCWGYNMNGQIGNNSTTNQLTPSQIIASGVTDVSVNGNNTCAIVNGAVQCWGSNMDGQVGDNTLIDKHTPVTVLSP